MSKINFDKAKRYSKKLFNPNNGTFNFFENGHSTILSTAFGVQQNYLLDNLHNYPLQTISQYFNSSQDCDSGLFIDKQYDLKNNPNFEQEYVLWQFSFFSIIALDMMGEKPLFPLNFLNELKNSQNLEKWLNSQNYENFWYGSNKIMFLFYFLIYEQERDRIDNSNLINLVLNFLDQKQDKKTGYWGTNIGASLENGMYGAAHVYLFYNYCNRDILHKEAIIENTLNLQNKYNLYGSKYGGACEDYNAVEILYSLSKSSEYKKDQINSAVSKIYSILRKSQNRDGGFSYRLDKRNLIEKFVNSKKGVNSNYCYSGWNKMENSLFNSDLWGTYFRILTIAKIEKMMKLPSYKNFKFYNLPGWGH